MADIELVIKIDEDDYRIMQHNIAVNNPLCPLSQEEMVSKVANGVPLPKGHGDLIALKQEPCKDAISRQAVLNKILKFSVTDGSSVSVTGLWTEVNDSPPVTPQPKTGHWVDGENTRWKCSRCGYGVLDWNTTPYCPNCGAKMEVTTDADCD